MAFWEKQDSPNKYLERREQRVLLLEEISEVLGYALDNQVDAIALERIDYFLPTLERVLAEHQADNVNDHNLSVQHKDDLRVMADDIQDLKQIRSELLAKGYR